MRAVPIRRSHRVDEQRLADAYIFAVSASDGCSAKVPFSLVAVDVSMASAPRKLGVRRLGIRHDDVEAVCRTALDHENEAAVGLDAANAICGDTRIAPAPAAAKLRNWRREIMMVISVEVGRDEQQRDRSRGALGARHRRLGRRADRADQQRRPKVRGSIRSPTRAASAARPPRDAPARRGRPSSRRYRRSQQVSPAAIQAHRAASERRALQVAEVLPAEAAHR